MNPGRDIEHGRAGAPSVVTHGQSMVSQLEGSGNESLSKAWSIATARSNTANMLPSPPYTLSVFPHGKDALSNRENVSITSRDEPVTGFIIPSPILW